MQSEDTLTVKLVDLLETMRSAWNIEPQNTQTFLDSRKKPDFTVKEKRRNPIVAEVKIDNTNSPDLSGEDQAKKHLGRRLASYEIVTTAMAVRFPYRFRNIPNRDLMDEIHHADDLYYVLLSGERPRDAHRFPNEGWIKGSVSDIATAIRIGAMPTSEVENAAFDLEYGVDEAAKMLESAIEERPEIGEQIEGILYQESCIQTSRMAMLIITNAFVFQSTLARKIGLEDVPALGQLNTLNQRLNVSDILEAWDKIYQVNYRPIFAVAINLVKALASDDELVGQVLWGLRETARKLINKGIAQVHELAGIVFQRLIVDRKFIKTYYTRPESVTLLSALVLPERDFINEDPDVIKESLSELKVADFACGTGALLNGVYQRLLGFYEQAGGIAKSIHKDMVENNLVSCDIMPNASHLTASLIASNFPDVKINDTRIDVMKYAIRHDDGRWALGALDLIEDPESILPIDLNTITTQRLRGGDPIADVTEPGYRHREMDIIVDNPPYTRVGADNSADNPEVPKTVFGEKNPEVAKQMRLKLGRIRDTIGNISAGFASYFVDLAHRMLKTNGQSVMGFVLPITALISPDWQEVRKLWKREYYKVVVVTIADAKTENCSFSADTNMAECLVVATKGEAENTGRGTFVCLHHRPGSRLEAHEIARDIQNLQNVRRFEEPPIAGNPIKVGTEVVGSALDCPLTLTEPWVTTRVKELSLIQSAHHLANGNIWLPEQPTSFKIPMATVGEMAEVGFDSNKITGKNGAFDIVKTYSDADRYAGLWHVKAAAQRAMMVQPDCHCIIRSGYWNKAQQVLSRNSRVHHMAKLRFNANSLAVLFTERDAIGVNTLPNVAFTDPDYDYVWTLWGNSTLGLLCYWMHGNKQHSGRGQIRLTALRAMPTLDMRKLEETALQNAKCLFEEMKHKRMLPFNQMDEDPVRWELDQLLLSQVLGFTEDTHPEIHEGLRILRERLCKEPSIHGGKQGKVVL